MSNWKGKSVKILVAKRERKVEKDTVETAGKPATTLEPVKMTEKSLI